MLLPDTSTLITEALVVLGKVVIILSAVLLLKAPPPSKSIHPVKTTPVVPVPDIFIGEFKRISAASYEYALETIIPNWLAPVRFKVPSLIILQPPFVPVLDIT